MGASRVIAVDVSEEKLELAREAGATTLLLARDLADNAERADVVIEAVGLDPTINAAVMLGAPGAHVTLSAYRCRT